MCIKWLGLQQVFFNQALLMLAIKMRTVAIKVGRILTGTPLTEKEDKWGRIWLTVATLVNVGLTAYKTKTSGPFIVKWHVVLPLCLELAVPVATWLIMIDTSVRFWRSSRHSSSYKLRVPFVILAQLPAFTFLFVNLVWVFQYEGYSDWSYQAKFVWDMFCVSMVFLGQILLQAILVLI